LEIVTKKLIENRSVQLGVIIFTTGINFVENSIKFLSSAIYRRARANYKTCD